jgi:hypothetical protein
MSTVSLSFYKARQQTSWYDASTNPTLMGYNNDSYYDQGVVYQMPVSITAGYVIQKLTFNIGNISSRRAFDNTNVYAVIYSYDPTGSFSNNTAPANYTWRGSAYTYINGDSGTSKILVGVDVNITTSGTYYLFLSTDSGSPLDPFMRGSTNISCAVSEVKPETPATSISVSTTLYMDQRFQIVWNPSRSDYKYDVWYSFVHHGGAELIGEKVTGGTMWYTAPSDPLASNIPNTISGSFKIYVDSYNSSGAKVGETSSEFTLSIPTNNRAPTCTDGWASASYEVKAGNCVAGFSEVKATLDISKITCNYGSKLKEVRVSCNSFNTSVITSGTFNLGKAITGNNIVTVTAYDSRGLSTTYTKTIVGKAYYPPSFNSLSVIRCDASGNESSSGTYYAVIPSVSHTSYDGNNGLLIKTRWQVFGGTYSSYIDVENNVKSAPQGGGNIATTSSYLIEVFAIDTFSQSSTQTRTLTNTSVAATLNLKSNGLGAAFFGLSSRDKELTVFGRLGVTPPVDGVNFTAGSTDGALLMPVGGISRGDNNGIYKGNGDGNGLVLGNSDKSVCNLAIKSWYSVGFVDGYSEKGITVGIDCREGTIAVRNGVIREGVGTWGIGGRSAALVRNTTWTAVDTFYPITSCKSSTGTWDVGTLNDSYYFSFASDTDFNNSNNVTQAFCMNQLGDMHVPTTVFSSNINASNLVYTTSVSANYVNVRDGGIIIENLGASSGTAEPSGGASGKLYFQYS